MDGLHSGCEYAAMLRALDLDCGFIGAVAYTPDGRRSAFSGANGSAHLCDLTNGRRQLLLHDQPSTVSTLAFSGDGRLLILGNRVSGAIQLWEHIGWEKSIGFDDAFRQSRCGRGQLRWVYISRCRL